MEKSKALMLGIIGVLIVIVAVFGFREVRSPTINPECYLKVSNVPICWTGEGWSDNPPYFVGEKYYWYLHITVIAEANMSDIVVSDGLGGEFILEAVSFVPIEQPGPYNYTFYYSFYAPGGGVSVTDGATVWWGYLDETGVTFDGFFVYWTGESLEAHLEWDLGSMDAKEVKDLYLTISTDTSPDGQQEFTSSGTYLMNSGATVKGIIESTGQENIAKCLGIEIEALEKIESE